jgi:hypothetical protein
MRAIPFLSLGILAGLSSGGFANETLRLHLTPTFSYRDFSRTCRVEEIFPRSLSLALNIDGNRVIGARLTDRFDFFAKEIDFDANEVKGIHLHRDASGRAWLKSLTLGPRHLVWFFFLSSDCRPTQELRTINKAINVFEFETQGLGEFCFDSQTPPYSFYGALADGSSYTIRMALTMSAVER